MSSLRVIAPAKINWTLEALRVRPDGYHELRSILQTIDLHDTITLTPAGDITLEIIGDDDALADEPVERNLAWRAAAALRDACGSDVGVRIRLDKRIPVAAGLGGGSSDAAAVLRGCNVFWSAGKADAELMRIAAGVGSDPPFFITGGTAAISGRGEIVEALQDAIASRLMVAVPPAGERGEKTASMFGALTPACFTDGDATDALRDAVNARREITDGALMNVFEGVTTKMQLDTERAMDALRAQGYAPHLAGAGPSFFLLMSGVTDSGALESRVRDLGFEPIATGLLPRVSALAIESF